MFSFDLFFEVFVIVYKFCIICTIIVPLNNKFNKKINEFENNAFNKRIILKINFVFTVMAIIDCTISYYICDI